MASPAVENALTFSRTLSRELNEIHTIAPEEPTLWSIEQIPMNPMGLPRASSKHVIDMHKDYDWGDEAARLATLTSLQEWANAPIKDPTKLPEPFGLAKPVDWKYNLSIYVVDFYYIMSVSIYTKSLYSS